MEAFENDAPLASSLETNDTRTELSIFPAAD